MKSELDLFQPTPIQASILRSEEVCYNPVNSLDSTNTLEYICLGHGDTYRDLSSICLRLTIKVTKVDKTDYKTTDATQPSIVNNILHSLFRSCSIYLNNKLVSSSDSNYHYRAYIENLLNYGTDAVNTHIETEGWVIDNDDLDDLTKNTGLVQRAALLKDSATIEIMGKIHADIFNQPKLLLNNVDLKVVLELEKPSFYIMEPADINSTIQIQGAVLHVKHVTISPNVLLAHHQILNKTNALYEYKHTEIKTFTVPSGNHSISLDNAIVGRLPNVLLFTFVENEAYTGSKLKNPYNFKHMKLTHFCLYVNGIQIPNQVLEADFSSGVYTRLYRTLFTGTGIHHHDRGHQITRKAFAAGFFLLAFDLTTDGAAYDSCRSLLNQGTIRIDARFKEPLEKTVTCIVYAEYDATMEIDKNRNILLN